MPSNDAPAEKQGQPHHGPAGFLASLTTRFPILKTKRGLALVIGLPVLIVAGGLCGLVALNGRSSGGRARDGDAITDDGYFYGQSPPVYPSPPMKADTDDDGLGDALGRAKEMVSNMTLEEKVSVTTGGSLGNGCHGAVRSVDRLEFPGLCLCDAGNGLRATDFVSSYPSGIHAGASWNRDLAHSRARAMGAEFRKKGVNIHLGPVAGPLGRIALGGRNWEGFGSDPYLSGVFTYESVIGMQEQGVIATTKHFIGNEQETHRNPVDDVESVSSNIDDKTMHELPFQDAVRAGSGAIMCSYQRINNSYGCANSKTLNGLLKTELGFQGFVVSDWDAQHAGYPTALAGMDLAMPDSDGFWGDRLVEAVRNGTVPESRVDDMAHRILAAWYLRGQDGDFPAPGRGMPVSLDDAHEVVEARDPDERGTRFRGAVEGHVLVKNTKGTLPLGSPRQLSVFGYSAKSPDVFAPVRGGVGPKYRWAFGAEPVSGEEVSAGFGGHPFAQLSATGMNGTMLSGGGSGSTTPALFVSPLEALKMRAAQNGTAMLYDLTSADPVVSTASDACIVLGNAWASEGYDRPAARDDYTDGLVRRVADRCGRTVVVLHNAGARLVDGFVDHPNVSAIIMAHLPGEETGAALVSLLYGDDNFSGKLPYTVGRNETDYGAILGPSRAGGGEDRYAGFPQSNFSEGVYIDHHHFRRGGIEPRYEFGFGLSYTSFSQSNLSVGVVGSGSGDGPPAEWPTGDVVQGGQRDLWDTIATVEATVTNDGGVHGGEVVQVYVDRPGGGDDVAGDDGSGESGGNGQPRLRVLRGFSKHFLDPGESQQARFNLTRRDLSVWSTGEQKWHLQRGEYTVHLGNSSSTLPLSETFVL
ncbi:beta-glucosidase [Geosmithia morbida]|uniref:Beta-glucosidase cel3A n=1 Tax=Geosmithia morbida TaxID=1094350 RepID=A0A9P4YT70_9HYPO|nr:beta-glucosidase [Geosmithia morbida]KAF4122663.1 beta-glucosidase [Geosmithia morbida]